LKKIFYVIALICFSSIGYAETMSGPRFGVTYLSPKTVDFIKDKDFDVKPFITQFGWHFERKFLTTNTGPEGVTALIPLIGGVEQGVVIPSLTWITGLRLRNGYEFGVGPNVSIGTAGMAFVFGHTGKLGELYIPKNIGVVLSQDGIRVSFLFGFNSSDRFNK